jgi:tryptophanyl-tRNA synthetase
MASDILLYDTDIVPVGGDQKQHIELCRDIAARVNNRYGGVFKVPEGRFLRTGARIMSLDDPLSKMSKSAVNPLSSISLLDDEPKIRKAVMRATTDSGGEIRFDAENKPGISNLLNIYSAFSGASVAEIEKKYEGAGYGTFKNELAAAVTEALTPIRTRFNEIRESGVLKEVLRDGAERANEIAEKTLKRVKERLGLGIA